MANKTGTIPARLCEFRAEVELRERADENQRSTPFTAVARTGDALTHAYWGRVVHDLDGMRHKPRIPIDFNHNPDDIVGYANRFDSESGDLKIGGALTPSKHEEFSRASEIIDKGEMGVPWEMSISFPGDLEIEEISDGDKVTVNQREFTGPLTVIRSWTLRGVAVTPYGHDSQTSLNFANDADVTFTVRNKEFDMSEDVKQPEAEAEQAVETKDTDSAEVVETVEATTEAATEEATAEATAEAKLSEVSDGKAYMAAFGRVQGALYFADGLSFEDAQAAELKRLQEENAVLKQKQAAEDGEEAVHFSQSGEMESEVLHEVPAPRATQVLEQ